VEVGFSDAVVDWAFVQADNSNVTVSADINVKDHFRFIFMFLSYWKLFTLCS
jgi:hypothetical protein